MAVEHALPVQAIVPVEKSTTKSYVWDELNAPTSANYHLSPAEAPAKAHYLAGSLPFPRTALRNGW